jgi:hypothetical protein
MPQHRLSLHRTRHLSLTTPPPHPRPPGATPLPPGLPPFEAVLGSFGSTAGGRAPAEAGADRLFLAHAGGSASGWRRRAGALTYELAFHAPLLPPPAALPRLAGDVAPPALAAVVAAPWAGPWRGEEGGAAAGAAAAPSRAGSAELDRPHPGRVLAQRSQPATPSAAEAEAAAAPASFAKAAATVADAPDEGARRSLLVFGVAVDGALWQWDLPLRPPAAPPAGTPPPEPPVRLLGVLAGLSAPATALSMCPCPVLLPGTGAAAAVGVVGTAGGTLELAVLRRGARAPLHLAAAAALAAHGAAPVGGARWLGRSARCLSFSSEPAPSGGGGFRNALLLTDLRSGASTPLRTGGAPEAAPVAGVRATPSGALALVVFRDAPSEVWALPEGGAPERLRQVDLRFTAVEWAARGAGGWADVPRAEPADAPASWDLPPAGGGAAGDGDATAADGGTDATEERLLFALADGRVGVLRVRGRNVTDARPAPPLWAPLAAGDFRATAAATWGRLALLGGADGSLVSWDTATGRCAAVGAGLGRIHRLAVLPPRAGAPGAAPHAAAARVAVLSASGAVALYLLAPSGELVSLGAPARAAGAARVTHAEWAPLPGGGAALVATLEDGSLAALDAEPGRGGGGGGVGGGEEAAAGGWALAAGPAPASPLALPRAWRALLRALLAAGAPAALLARCGAADAPGAEGRLDAELRAALGVGDAEAFEPASAAGADTLAELLDQQRLGGGGGKFGSPPARGGAAEAAAALGYRPPAAPAAPGGGTPSAAAGVAGAFRTVGGAMRELAQGAASAGREGLSRSLGRPGGADASPAPDAAGRRGSSALVLDRGAAASGAPAEPAAALRAAAALRGLAAPLAPAELAAYAAAAARGGVVPRMEAAAELDRDAAEARFWRRLPATLARLGAEEGAAARGAAGGGSGGSSAAAATLWDAGAEIAEAAERARWRAGLGRAALESSESNAERRLLELVALRDLHGAVGLLLGAPPERSARFYRGALAALGMAFACDQGAGGAGGDGSVTATSASAAAGGSSLFVQAAGVIAANAAAAGDALVGVPLLAATGRHADAVGVLQDAGLWATAAALAAGALAPPELAPPLERWAGHAAGAEGRPWWAAGLLVAAGLPVAAAEALLQAGAPDAAAALVAACAEAGVASEQLRGGAGAPGGAIAERARRANAAYVADLLRRLPAAA